MKVFKLCGIVAIVYTFLLAVYKLFSNSEYIWKSKFLVDILSETISLIIFTMLIKLLQKNEYIEQREGYIFQLEESKDLPSQVTRHQNDNTV